MLINILTNGNAQVTIDQVNVSSVSAAINISIMEGEANLLVSLFPFLNNRPVNSNVVSIQIIVPNNTETDPALLIAECNDAICTKIVEEGFLIEIIN